MSIKSPIDSKRSQLIATALSRADMLKRTGHPDQAESICLQLLADDPDQIGALNFLALQRWGRNDLPEAEKLLARAVGVAPTDAGLHSNFGALLHQLGKPAEAEACLRRAIKLAPVYPEAYYNLGIVLRELGRTEEALAAQRRANLQKPRYAEALVQEGVLLKELGRNEDALRSFDGAISARNNYFDAHYYRGDTLDGLGRFEDAVAAFESALRLNPESYNAVCARAATLVKMRRDPEALAAYRLATEMAPGQLRAHNEYSALAWSMGHRDQAFSSYATARTKIGDHPDLLLAEAAQRLRADDALSAEQLLRRAKDMAPGRIDITCALGRALAAQQRFSENVELLEAEKSDGASSLDFQRDLAIALLRNGDPAKAARLLESALGSAPFDQFLLAFLTLAYRETGDGRLENLLSHEKFVRTYDLPLPAGFADTMKFNNQLSGELIRFHTRKSEPIDQSLRGGTQTVGHLFRERSDIISALRGSIDAAVADYIAALPDDPNHPVSGRRSREFNYSGAWSCFLHEGGFHRNHVHHKGWISSAYYVELPDATKDDSEKQGWLKFGESNFALSGRDTPEKLVQPTVGKLVLFPSYYWHGTVPFASSDARLTVAFDVVPQNEAPGAG